MKGVINKGIQDFVERKFGAETWDKVKSIAGCNEPFFALTNDYPDEMTHTLIKAASEVTKIDMETVMVDFGKFVVPNTMKEQYQTYFQMAGSSPREFLLNMSLIHERATKSIPNAAPPRFEYEELADGRLLMHYYSKRGLCAILRGAILGVGINFGQQLGVRETACIHKGDKHCTMEITFPQTE